MLYGRRKLWAGGLSGDLSAQQQGALPVAEPVVLGLVGTFFDGSVDNIPQLVEAYLPVDALHVQAFLEIHLVIVGAVECHDDVPPCAGVRSP